jgi:hypothetical protein
MTPTVPVGDPSRPSRLQLACPEPEEPIVFRNSASLSTRRQQDSTPTNMPQQQLLSNSSSSSSSSSSDDEILTTTTTVTKEMDRDVPSAEPSPTLEPKFDHSQQPASYGLPLSSESPFVPSLSYEFSAKRVCCNCIVRYLFVYRVLISVPIVTAVFFLFLSSSWKQILWKADFRQVYL